MTEMINVKSHFGAGAKADVLPAAAAELSA